MSDQRVPPGVPLPPEPIPGPPPAATRMISSLLGVPEAAISEVYVRAVKAGVKAGEAMARLELMDKRLRCIEDRIELLIERESHR